MKKLQHVQATISLVQGDAQKEVDISSIQGSIVGYSSKLIGSIPDGKSADLSIYDGATTALMPIDVAVSEVSTKNSFQGSICPLSIERPGRISAVVTPSSPIGAGEDFKVKVIIYYAVDTDNAAGSKISDCF